MHIRFDGLDDLHRKIDRLQRRVEKVGGTTSIALDELFPPEFMTCHTQFHSFQDMVEQSGFAVDTPEDFANIPDEWNMFVATYTLFASWQDMQAAAVAERVQGLLNG